MPKKSWETLVPPRDEPVDFTLNGDHFVCLDEIPAGAFGVIASWSTTTGAALDFVEACLLNDDYVVAWRRVTRSRERVVPKETVVEIMNWLLEEYSKGRPTQSSSASARGPQATSNGSVDDSSAKVTA